MDLSFLDTKTILLIVHLFGVVLGAGGAFASDAMFFKSVKDEHVTKTELGFLTLGSTLVIAGLVILILSGIGLFLLDPAGYLASSKFLAKMTIVAVIIVNGIVFHKSHLPRLHRHAGQHFPSSDEFVRHRNRLLASGVVSMVSWISAIILGSLRAVPYSYAEIMFVYLVMVLGGVGMAIFIKEKILPSHSRKR